MVNQNTNEAMAALYGAPAQHSEYSRFTRVTYREAGAEHSGLIIWVLAPTDDSPLQYVVEPSQGGFPEFLYATDIIAEVK